MTAYEPPPPGRIAAWLLRISALAALAMLWEVAPGRHWVDGSVVPPLSQVLRSVPTTVRSAAFTAAVVPSLTRWLIGLLVALAAGLVLGTVMGRSRAAYRLLNPLVVFGYAVPKAGAVLVLVLLIGIGNAALVLVVVGAALIPIVVATYHAMHDVDGHLLWTARSLGYGPVRRWRRVMLPATLPFVLSGLRIAVPISLAATVGGELLLERNGVGDYLLANLDYAQYDAVWSATLLIAAFGVAVDLLLSGLTRRAMPWHEGDV